MSIRSPFYQIGVLTALSLIIGIGSNGFRSDSIPLLARELETVEQLATSADPEATPYIKAVNLSLAKSLHDEGALFVDAREVESYGDGHIPGALPYGNFMELAFTLDSLIGRASPFIVYCSDDDCGSSEELAYDLQNEGFLQILVFKGGWLEWIEAGYPEEK